jgi:hypothetical protein
LCNRLGFNLPLTNKNARDTKGALITAERKVRQTSRTPSPSYISANPFIINLESDDESDDEEEVKEVKEVKECPAEITATEMSRLESERVCEILRGDETDNETDVADVADEIAEMTISTPAPTSTSPSWADLCCDDKAVDTPVKVVVPECIAAEVMDLLMDKGITNFEISTS